MADPVHLCDFYCGAGGFSTGASRVANVKVALAVDSPDQYGRTALYVHKQNHPEAEHVHMWLGPDREDKMEELVRCRVPPGTRLHIHGSPPCQAFTAVAVKKDHSNHVNWRKVTKWRRTQSEWFVDFLRRAKDIFHDYRVTTSLENVPGIRNLPTFQNERNAGMLRACDFGGATVRRRYIFGTGWSFDEVAARADSRRAVSASAATEGTLTDEDFVCQKSVFGRTLEERLWPCTKPIFGYIGESSMRVYRKNGADDYDFHRHITPNEAAQAAGYPSGYFRGLQDSHKSMTYLYISNSVPTHLATAVMTQVVKQSGRNLMGLLKVQVNLSCKESNKRRKSRNEWCPGEQTEWTNTGVTLRDEEFLYRKRAKGR